MPGQLDTFNEVAVRLGIPAAIIAALFFVWFEMGRRRVWVWGSTFERCEKECERLRGEINKLEEKYELRIERMRGQVDSAYTYLDRVSQQSLRVTQAVEKAMPMAPPSQEDVHER